MEPHDLAILRRHLPITNLRVFGFLLRVSHRFLPGRYEDYSWFRKKLYEALGLFDSALLSLPGFQRLGSTAVISYGGMLKCKLRRHYG